MSTAGAEWVHQAELHQTASAIGTEEQLQLLVERLASVVDAPWEVDRKNGPKRFHSLASIPKPVFGFGPRPDYVFFRRHQDNVSARASNNRTLAEFFGSFVEPCAAEVGLAFTLSDATLPIPEEFQRDPMEVPGIGTLNPSYDSVESLSYDDGWITEPAPLPCLNGLPISFRVREAPFSESQAGAIGEAISYFRGLGADAVLAWSELVFAYYRACREGWSDDDCRMYDVPILTDKDAVWDNVAFPNPPEVYAYEKAGQFTKVVTFRAQCLWEVEHGLQLTFEDGQLVTAGAHG